MLHHGLLTVRRRVMAGAGIIALIGATTAANVDQRLADAAERQDWRTLHALLEAHAPPTHRNRTAPPRSIGRFTGTREMPWMRCSPRGRMSTPPTIWA